MENYFLIFGIGNQNLFRRIVADLILWVENDKLMGLLEWNFLITIKKLWSITRAQFVRLDERKVILIKMGAVAKK